MTLSPIDIALLIGLGFGAGVLGGMLGIGGSIIMIPAMVLLFGARSWHSQHLYQAAAMLVNVAVAVPATLRHRRAGTVRRDMTLMMLWPTLVAIVAGVLLSNALDTRTLQLLFSLFLLYVVADNALRLARHQPDYDEADMRLTPLRVGASGGVMGAAAGLLGVGGGGVAVPMLQVLCRAPLRHAIGAAAAVMVLTATIGAALKTATIGAHGIPWTRPLLIALCLGPSAFVGGRLGADLTHRAPLFWVRAVFTLTMLGVALRLVVDAWRS